MEYIRPATAEDLARCREIYRVAQEFMVRTGNPNQWQVGFPPQDLIERDIADRHLMVWTDAEDVPQGAFAFLPGPEPDYAVLYEGGWHDDGRYRVLHRFAAARQGQGIGSAMMRWALAHAKKEGVALRVDTHRDNIAMQRLLRRFGFTRCGIIHLARTGDERIAFTHVF